MSDKENKSDIEIRMQLLHLSKDILEHRAHLKWETHKKAEEVTIDEVIVEAKKLYNFVQNK